MIPFVGEVVPGYDCYAMPRDFPDRYRRAWHMRGAIRSVEQRPRGIVKDWTRFDEHGDADTMRALLVEAEARGVVRPSSYGDLFQQEARDMIPRCRSAPRKLFGGVIPGGWQSVLTAPHQPGPLWQYDIRSAYLSAFANGMPHPDTYIPMRRELGPGVYWVASPGDPSLPLPWCSVGWFPATWEEIETFHLPRQSITRGVSYEPNTFDTAPLVRMITSWRQWKPVARSFWGRWGASAGVECTTFDVDQSPRTRTALADPSRNPIWAAILCATLRLRLWEVCWQQPVCRVFVDSVVTTAPLDSGIGDDIGQWKLVKHFPRGGCVGITGVSAYTAATMH